MTKRDVELTLLKDVRVQLSIPSKLKNVFLSLPAKANDVMTQYRFVLTPSYRINGSEWLSLVGKASKRVEAFPSECRLDYSKVLSPDDRMKTVQIIFTRPEQFDAYVQTWGQTCVIAKLPGRVSFESGHLYGKSTCSVGEGGVGFARLVGQMLAYELGLVWVHMWDDNVIKCKEFHENGTLEDVSFSRVFQQMEAIVRGDIATLNKEAKGDVKIKVVPKKVGVFGGSGNGSGGRAHAEQETPVQSHTRVFCFHAERSADGQTRSFFPLQADLGGC